MTRMVFNRLLAMIGRQSSSGSAPGDRKTLVSSKHVARWSADGAERKLTIDSLGGETGSGLVLQLVERRRNWTTTDGGPGPSVRPECTLHVLISRDARQSEVADFAGADRRRADDEFDRIADGLIAEFFGGQAGAAPSARGAAVVPQRSWPNRFFRALVPWVGGGLAVIAFSLAMTSQHAGGLANASAGAALEPNGLASPPEAWNALSPSQKQTLLRMTAQAAEQVAQEQRTAFEKIDKPQAASGQPTAPVGSRLTPEQMKMLMAAPSLKVGKGGKVFYAFEDPLCGSCQHLASQAQTLDPSFGMVVVPIGFQPGGRDKAAAALCSKDPLEAWAVAMRGLPIDAKPCEAGYRKVDQNNAMFTAFGLRSTPTMVAANAALIAGSGEASEIAGWVNKNIK